MLKKMGHKIRIASNGKEAIDQFNSEKPDLILMDCEMPEVDGYSATKTIRKLEKEKEHTPIVALTAHALPERLKTCIEENFTAFTMTAFLIIYWIASITGNLNIGVRHVLPVFPFTFIILIHCLLR